MSTKIALLIDAENISHKDLPRILKEVSRQGEIVLHAIYADWENPIMQKWKELAEKANFTLRHQSNHSQTKNSSDMRLIMDAMEILFRTQVDVFCLVSNDADYVPLCQKLQESKKYVIGVGYQNASDALIRACNQYIFIGRGETVVQSILQNSDALPAVSNSMESVQPEAPQAKKVNPPVETAKQVKANPPAVKPQVQVDPQKEVRKLISAAIAQAPQDENKWVTLSALGSALSQIQAGFKPNTYGHSTLSKLLQNMPDFVEMQTKGSVKSARLKKAK